MTSGLSKTALEWSIGRTEPDRERLMIRFRYSDNGHNGRSVRRQNVPEVHDFSREWLTALA